MFKMLKDVLKNENVKTGLKVVGKVSKAIVWEGIKGVAVKGATKVITTSFESGIDGVKRLTIDDYVGAKKPPVEVNHDIPKSKSNKEKARVEVEAEWAPVDNDVNDGGPH